MKRLYDCTVGMNTRLTTRPTIILLPLLAFGCCLSAPPHTCTEINQGTFKVERVVDGDTFKVTYDGESTSVRLIGIDAPERKDPAGPAATKALMGLIDGKAVRLEFTEPRKRDNFGRLLCKVFVGDVDVGQWMLDNGHAVRYVPRR